MLVSYRWLAELVDLEGQTPEEVAALLTDLGLEAAIADDRRGWYDKVVCGRVLTCEKHPNADKLSLTTVNVGGPAPIPIVCGAANVRAGIDVPVALVGAVLPGDFKIEKRKVRGEVSEGMICSEAELALTETADGILILDDAPAPGTPFGVAYEVCDTVIEVDLTPNRGDCASMIGVAREVAAKRAVPLLLPDAPIEEEAVETHHLVTI
ncbi:MAG: phenylalanine--tRNA ligase subunit beta, partial [Nitrospinae bacterium]|nr:phenylalanine--tRNA ligase subunit beta [Nitrospinota bacterium]